MDVDYIPSECSTETNSLFTQDSDSAAEHDENNNVVLKKSRRSASSGVKLQKIDKLEQYDYEREKEDSSLYSSCFNNLPLNRSSLGLFPRQSSGINVILDKEEEPEGPKSHLCSGHVRNSYDPKPTHVPPQPHPQPPPSNLNQPPVTRGSRIRLSTLLFEQMKALEAERPARDQSSKQSSSVNILNKSFFGALDSTVRSSKMLMEAKEHRNSQIADDTSIDDQHSYSQNEHRKSIQNPSKITDITGEDSISRTSRSSNAPTRSSKSKGKADYAESAQDLMSTRSTKDKTRSVQDLQSKGVKLTGVKSTDCTQASFREKTNSSKKSTCSLDIVLSQSDVTPGVISRVSMSSLKAPTNNKKVIELANSEVKSTTDTAPKDDGDSFTAKETSESVELSKEKEDDTEMENLPEKIEIGNQLYELDLINSALSLAGDSVATFFKIITNIVPSEGRPPSHDEIEAKQDTFGISLLSFLGLSKETSTHIYQEACDEIETFKDVSVGTVDTIADLVKWLLGKSEAREKLKYKTRAYCSMNSEVDMNSEIWKRLGKCVESSVDPVDAQELEALAELEKLSKLEKLNELEQLERKTPLKVETRESEDSFPDADTTLNTLNNDSGDLHSYMVSYNAEGALSTARSLSCIPEEDEVASSCGKGRKASRETLAREIVGNHLANESYARLLEVSLSKHGDSETTSEECEDRELEFDGQITDVEEEYFHSQKSKNEVKPETQESIKNLIFLDEKFSDYIIDETEN